MFGKNQLEDECYTCHKTVALEGSVLAFVAVEQTPVITYVYAEFVHNLDTAADTCKDVKTAVVLIVVVVSSVRTATDNRADTGLGAGSYTHIGCGASINEELEVRSKLKGITQVQRNIYIMLCGLARNRKDVSEACTGGIGEELIVKTGVQAQTGHNFCAIAKTCIEAI